MSESLIHDIGYRHYEGPRLGRAYLVRSLYVHNLRAIYGMGRTAKSKLIPISLSILMLIPAIGSIAVTSIVPRNVLIPYAAYPIALQPLIAVFLAAQSPIVGAREIRSHTVPLYFSRPVGFLDFVLAKYAALASAVFLLIAAPETLLYIGSLITKQPDHVFQAGHWLLALVGCALFALVLAGIGLLIASIATRRGFGIAAIIAAYLFSSAIVGVVQSIASREVNDSLQAWAGLFTPFSLVDSVQVGLLDGQNRGRVIGVTTGIGMVALLICVAVVAACTALLYARFRKAGR